MSLAPYVGPLAWAQAAGTAVAATTTRTSLLTGGAATGKWAMPGGFFIAPGQRLRLTASGIVSTPAATQGNLTLGFDIGAVNVATSAAFVSLASQTNITWRLRWDLLCLSVGDGTLATFRHSAEFITALVSATNLVNLVSVTTGTGFNSSTAASGDLFVTWSNATAGNTIQLQDYALESVV